jgi:single-strand DNA-binding protein
MANFNLNKVILGGRLTADPELKTTPSGVSVTTFTVAVNRRGKDEQAADFFTVTAWRQTAEFITKYFGKGSSICVVGSLQNRSWEKDGQKHYATEIVADEACFVDSRSETITANAPAARVTNTPPAPVATPGAQTQFEEIGDDEELPF